MLRNMSIALIGLTLIILGAMMVSFELWKSRRLSALEEQTHVIETSIGPIQYSKRGTDGPTVLLFHGTPGGADHTLPGRAGLQILTPSRPGYLGTPLALGATPQEQAAASLELIKRLNIDRVVALGISGGGPAALSFALNYPEHTDALVGVAPVSGPLLASETETIPAFMHWTLFSDFLYWLNLSTQHTLQGENSVSDALVPDAEAMSRIRSDATLSASLNRLPWMVWPVSQRLTGWQNDLSQFANFDIALEKLTVPVLLFHGTDDAQLGIAHSERIVERTPGARLHAIDGGTHLLMITHAAELRNITLAFLAEHGVINTP